MGTIKAKKHVKPLAYPWYFFTVVIIVLIGLFDSIYLSVSHYRVYTDIGYQSFCAISRAINCDTVSQSQYSIFIGVPVPVWGVLGYALIFGLLTFAWPQKTDKKRVWTLLFFISLGFSAYSLILAFISTFLIHSYCLMCILSYAVNLLLLYFTWLIRNRFKCESFVKAATLDVRYLLGQKATIPIFSTFITGALLMIAYFPPYWQMDPPDLSNDVPTGITEDGYHWIGAENPELVIVEFSDYRCFQCKKMHFFLRRIIQKHPEQIRLVHRHFPMDHTVNPLVDQPFHQGSANLSIIALFAAEKDKFWEMNDLIFNLPIKAKEIKIKHLAEQADIDLEEFRSVYSNPEHWKALMKDINDGLRYGLTGTPGFVINNQVYVGQIPPELLRGYI